MAADMLFRGVTIYPGDGPPFSGDLAVEGTTIAAIGPDLPLEGATETIDGEGLILAPGFIDMHAHSALRPFGEPELTAKVAQGFTTEVINPDGLAPAPVDPARRAERRAYLQALEGPGPREWTWTTLGEYVKVLAQARPATTLVPSIGHNAVRDAVMGGENRPPSPAELTAMRGQVRQGLEDGAKTFSFGLIYLPGAFADTDELAALAQEAAPFNAPLVPHVRNEGAGVLGAVGEMIEVSRRSGAPLHLSHLKVIGNRELVPRLLELIDEAANDIDITFDQYPYGAGSTLLAALLPAWAQAGGPQGTLARLRDAGERRRIEHDIRHGLPGWEDIYLSCGPENVVVVQAPAHRAEVIGKTLAQIGEDLGQDPLQAALDLLIDAELDVAMIDHYATEETVREIFRHPRALAGSDGIFGPHPHPRIYGTAPRILGRYAIREGLIPVEEAIARLTSRAADRLGLHDRGRIKEGLRADLVLLDPDEYVDTATYDEPKQTPPGVRRVVVAGQTVWRDGEHTGALPGGVIGA